MAALHPSLRTLTAPAKDDAGQHLRVRRTSVLEVEFLAVGLTNVLAANSGWHRTPGLLVTVVVAGSIVICFHPITRAQEVAATALRRMAEHDQLTSAANCEVSTGRLPDFVTTAPGAIVLIDLDGFKASTTGTGTPTENREAAIVRVKLSERV